MWGIFSIPSKENNYKAYMVSYITIIWSVVTGVIVSIGFIFFPEIWYRWLTFLMASIFIAVFNIWLAKRGLINLASWTLTSTLWLYVTVPCYSAGGIFAPGVLSQLSVILTAGILLGWRGGLLFGLLSMFTDLGFVIMEMRGTLPEPSVNHTPLTRWIGAIIPFGTIIALQYYSTNHLRSTLTRMEQEIKKREEAESIKNKTMFELKERVKELNAIYEVSNILHLNQLLNGEVFQNLAEKIANGWQYPEITRVRIKVGNETYTTPGYIDVKDKQMASLKTSKGTPVSLEVVYIEERPEMDEGPFLYEERNLIITLTEMICSELDLKENLMELKDYKYAVDVSSIVAISGVDGVFTHVNENFCTISKYSAEELVGNNYSLLWTENDSPEEYAILSQELAKGNYIRREFASKAKDGSIYWVDTTIIPFLNEVGEVRQYLSINHDITVKKLAEERIANSEKLLRKITSQVPGNTYMFKLNEEGEVNLLFVNKGTDQFNHLFSSEELIQYSDKLQEILHEDDKVLFSENMKEAYRTKGPLSFQYRMKFNGGVRWRWMQGMPEKQENGEYVWYAGTSDITPLVEYVSSIEQMIFDVSHVLRRPITNLLSISYLLSEGKVNEKDFEKLSEYLSKSVNEIDEFLLTLNDAYSEKRKMSNFRIDTDQLIDKRSTLFT